MSQPDPEKAILERLAGPVGRAQFGAPGPSGWRAASIAGGNWSEAALETVRFVKFRETPGRRLYFVTFQGSIPFLGPELHKVSGLYPVERDADGNWTAGGGAGGSDDKGMSRPTPWVNLAGAGWRQLGAEFVRALPGQFYAGGRVHSAGIDVARVQLRFADGVVLEDDTDEAIVLFITDQEVRLPATAVLLDRAGAQVASHPFSGV